VFLIDFMLCMLNTVQYNADRMNPDSVYTHDSPCLPGSCKHIIRFFTRKHINSGKEYLPAEQIQEEGPQYSGLIAIKQFNLSLRISRQRL